MRFTRIKSSFSEHRRIPRLGRIRLGLKVAVLGPDGRQKLSTSGLPIERPKETDHFVVPQEVADVYTDTPKELDIMLPNENPEVVFPQSLAWFGSTKGLKCTGDMETAERLNDKTGVWEKRSCPCEHYKSDTNPKGECTESGTLIFILPKVNMGGTYEVRTGSYNSVVDINSGIDYVRALIGRISMVPLKLRRVARETHAEGKKQIHHTLSLILDATIEGVNLLRNDTSRILSSAQLQIEGPSEVNSILDPVDVSEVDEDDSGIDAEKLADMDDKELERVQQKLREHEQLKRLTPIKPSPTTPLTQPHKPSAPTNGPAVQETLELPTPARLNGGLIDAAQWTEVITFIDGDMDLGTLKHDWNTENKVDNVVRLTEGGKQKFLEYMREKAGAAFPY